MTGETSGSEQPVAEPATSNGEEPRQRRGPPRAVLFGALPAIALFIGLLAYGLVTKAPTTGIDDSLANGRPAAAPGFELPVLQHGDLGPMLEGPLRRSLSDGRLSLNELRGTRVVLNFWASWCVPCQKEATQLERGWLRGRQQRVVFVGLNMQDLTGDARGFMRRYRNTYLNIRDRSNAVSRRWGLTGIPETFFITPRGRVVAHVIGVISEEQMRAGLAATATGRPVSSKQGGDRRPTN